jgi:hypothetical protein
MMSLYRLTKKRGDCIMEQNPVLSSELGAHKKNKKKFIVLLVLSFLLVAALGVGGYHFYQKKKQEEVEEYGKKLNFLVMNMLNTGADAEKMINGYIDVWHKAIFNAGVKINGKWYSNFNGAVSALKIQFEQEGKIEKLKDSLDKTEEELKELKNPPEEYKELYELAVDMYKAHKEFIEYAIDPSGSLQSYSSDARSLSQQFVNLYNEYNIKAPKTFLDDLEEKLEEDLEKVKQNQ